MVPRLELVGCLENGTIRDIVGKGVIKVGTVSCLSKGGNIVVVV